VLGTILSAVLAGFLFGSLARLAVPGPDPMPFSLTVLIGLAGSGVGAGIAASIWGASHIFDTSGRAFVTLMLEVGAATGLVAAYRHFVQKRPVWGPGARRFPERGLGVARMRARLRQLGIDPDRLPGSRGTSAAQPDPQTAVEELEKLREQRDRGELTDEEYEQARERLRRY
jgi:uncharacterized membrane protein YeaQ/YmgE (transglycosylase-associated protein family)